MHPLHHLTRWLCRPTHALLALAVLMFLADHHFSNLTWAALSLATGAFMVKGITRRPALTAP